MSMEGNDWWTSATVSLGSSFKSFVFRLRNSICIRFGFALANILWRMGFHYSNLLYSFTQEAPQRLCVCASGAPTAHFIAHIRIRYRNTPHHDGTPEHSLLLNHVNWIYEFCFRICFTQRERIGLAGFGCVYWLLSPSSDSIMPIYLFQTNYRPPEADGTVLSVQILFRLTSSTTIWCTELRL